MARGGDLRLIGAMAGLALAAVILPGCSASPCSRESYGRFTCQEVLDAARADVGLHGSNIHVVDPPNGGSRRTAPDIALVTETDATGSPVFIMVGLVGIDPTPRAWAVDPASYDPLAS
jgi:hypothetical protein